ncbi:hypothetical protein Acr_29g0006970 [Actinidia rufa]|uniref:Uncharacterized protein n=1 Tax=Actinidia rufa TaxID=165716 RepID=A0A7J0HEY7_9ERIC|nr:hypothetical protein Acr_29g0006970 [Actinidia rufa]
MVLSTSAVEVAFYEASFPTGLRCLYTLLKGSGSELGWLYFKARPSKNFLKGPPNNVKGWKRRFFFVSGDDWEFHLSIPHEEGAVRVSRSWGTPVILNSRTFHKYFATGRVEMSSSGGSTVKGDIGGEAEGDIGGGASTFVGHAMMSRRIKLSELAKVVAKKAATPSSKSVVIFEASKTTSKKRTLDDGSKGKQVALDHPLPEAKKIKAGSVAHAAPTRLSVIPGKGSLARLVPSEALGPQASVMASAFKAEKIMVGVILPADKEKVEKLTFDQVVTKFFHVLGQEVILGSSLAVHSRDFVEGALNQRALVESSELEMVRAQNRAIELEGALTKEKSKWKKVAEEVRARNKEVATLEARVAKLEKS